MQAYYGPGILPPTYFGPGISPGHSPPPYIWGPQVFEFLISTYQMLFYIFKNSKFTPCVTATSATMPSAFGKPYAAIYPHGGGFSHPFMPLMVNPLSTEPAKSVNSKENNLNKKLKEIDGTAVSTGTGNSEKTNGDYSVEGSSVGDNHKASGTPKKRSLDDRPSSDDKKALDFSPGAETGGASAPNYIPGEPGRLATLPNLRIPDTAIKPNASTASDFRVIGTPISTELPAKDDRESKRERRKQSNRESACRSRLRKQAETEELARKVELLTAENTSLRCEISRLTESSKKLRLENSALMEKLTDAAPDQAHEVSPALDQTTAPSARAVENFLSMIDNTNTSRSSGHMEHGAPKLRQLLGSGLATDVQLQADLPPLASFSNTFS